jgi:predicted ATPase/DNA-binding SARP family transcriptional activator
MARLSIRLLGPFQITLNGEPVSNFASDKVRALLAYLATSADRPHRREALAGLLWSDYPEPSARATLRNALANLRRAIDDPHAEPPHLEITRQSLQFNRGSDHWLDVAAFTAALEADTATRKELTDAVALYRGPFLDGFSLPDSAPFEEWLIATRENLGRQALGALRRLVHLHEQDGTYEDALPFAWQQVELEPWQEEGHQQVMRLLARTGRRSEALAQYERCRQTLQDELGAEPAAETTALYEAIRSGDLAPERPVAATARRPQAQYHLPPQPMPFVGREEELATLEALLHDPAVRLVTLLGPGGIGKTRLALAVGTRIANAQRDAAAESAEHAFPHGVVFVPLAPLSSAQDIAPAIAQALQLRLQGGVDQLRDYLRNRQLLLILDNVEHLLEPASLAQRGGAELLAHLVTAAPGVKLLATSRERLQLHGEHAFPVGGLALPDQDPSPASLRDGDFEAELHDMVEAYPAIKLFVLTARRLQPQLVVDFDAATIIARLCRLVDGMPLALELAASWTDTLPLDDILAEIRDSLDFLQTEWRDLPRRQHSMRAVFDASWARLGEAERAVFPQLSIFRGGFARAAAQQVAVPGMEPAAAARLLSGLVAKSFLQYDPSMQRFEIHELLRQYAGEKLAQDPDHEAEVRDRHSQHFCRWLQQMEHALKSPKQLVALDEMQPDIENARTACTWAAAQGEAERLAQAVDALGQVLLRRGNHQVGEHTFAGLATHLKEGWDPAAVADTVPRALARIVVWQSTFAGFVGNMERVTHMAHDGLALLDAPPLASQDTRHERADLYRQLGYAHYEANPGAAREYFRRSRDLYRELGDRWGLADALVGLGRTLRNLNAYDEAEAATAEALSLRRALDDDRGSAEALALLGNLAGWQIKFGQSEQLVRQSLALTPPQDREGIAYGQLNLGALLISSGRFGAAREAVAETLILYTELGMRHQRTYALLLWAQLHRHLGDYSAAQPAAEEALFTARELGNKRGIGLALGLMGALALAERAYAEARRLCEESVAAWHAAMGQPSRHEGELACLALASRALDQGAKAWGHLLMGLEWAASHRLFRPLLQALAANALLLADRGEAERAVEVYALAQAYPLVAHSRWFEDVAGREMADVAAGLPADVAQAAQARGQASELWSTAEDLLEEVAGLHAR